MTKNFRHAKASIILLMLLVSSTAAFSVSAEGKMITYPSYIEFDIPTEESAKLDQPLALDEVININFKIGYKIGPAELLDKGVAIPWGMLWLYSSFILFPQRIHLEVVDAPDWATVSITNPDPQIEITSDGGYAWADSTLVISPKIDAPAEPATFTIRATSETRGRIDGTSKERPIYYVPGYRAELNIEVENPTRQVGPRDTLNFKVTIENMGNKATRVHGEITGGPSNWAPMLSSSVVYISAGATKQVTFSVVTPYDFGWHNELESFTLEFTPEKVPAQTPPVMGSPHSAQVRVNSVGFSTPGFELIGLIFAIGVVAFIVKRRRGK